MLTPGTRFLIMLLAAIAGAACFMNERYLWAAPCFALGALMIWGYFRYGTVRLAFHAARMGDGVRAARRLAKIASPKWLSPQSLAYYHWIRGAVEADCGEIDKARANLLLALEGPLRNSNDRCVVACSLAELALRSGDMEGAREYLERAKNEPHKPAAEAMVKGIEEKLEAPPPEKPDDEKAQ